MVELSTPSNPRNPACWSTDSTSFAVSPSSRGALSRSASCRHPSARSAFLFLVSDPSAVCRSFTSSGLARAHLSSSQSVPVTVASACWAADDHRLGAVTVDTAHRDDAELVADEPAAHRERLQVLDHAAQLLVLARQAGRCRP